MIYTRVSGDEQIKGTSLEFQEESCRHYCAQRGIEVVALFREEGETATLLSLKNRRQFLAALEFCRKTRPKIDAFVVLKTSRFARNTEDHLSVRRILSGYGTTLHSVTEPIDDSPTGRFMETVLAGANEYENELRKQACIDGLEARLNHGIWPWNPPKGYVRAPGKNGSRKKTDPDVADGELFIIIQRGLAGYASGDIVSQGALAKLLTLWGFERLVGRPATIGLIHDMLTKSLPYYAGVLVNPWTGEERPGLHTPMISRADRARIIERRLGRAPSAVKRTRFNRSYPLRRILVCSACGSHLTGGGARGNGGTYGYYYCVRMRCPRRCKCIGTVRAHPAFDELLLRLQVNTDLLDRVEELVRAKWRERQQGSESHRNALVSTAKQLHDRRRRILAMGEDGTYDAGLVRERLSIVDSEIALMEAQPVSGASIVELGQDELVSATRWFLSDPAQAWCLLSAASRARFERLAFPAGLIFSNETAFQTAKPGPIFGLAESACGVDSGELYLAGTSSNQEYEYFSELVALYHQLTDPPQDALAA